MGDTRGTRKAKRVVAVAATSQSRRGGCWAAHLRLGSVGGLRAWWHMQANSQISRGTHRS